MNIKKILSTALVAVMLFSSIVACIPVTASAAHSSSSVSTDAVLGTAEVKAIVNTALTYNFNNAEEMLRYELGAMSAAEAEAFGLTPNTLNYLDHVISSDAKYMLYVNRYTGMVYYVNAITGQILTSNPYNVAYTTGTSTNPTVTEEVRQQLMSQLVVNFFKSSDNSVSYEYGSIKWASLYSQVSVSEISNGLRVNYTLGDTSTRFLLPGMLIAETYEEKILKPMLKSYEDLLEHYCRDAYPDTNFSFFGNEDRKPVGDNGYCNASALRLYFSDTRKLYQAIYKPGQEGYDVLDAANMGISGITNVYSLKDPKPFIGDETQKMILESMIKDFPITEDGTAIYVFGSNITDTKKRGYSNTIRRYASSYTFADMFDDEAACEYVSNVQQKPVVRCSLEYTFAEDGTLSVRLPANSISFDESVYTLESVVPLKYFGCGDLSEKGYIFYPDGSGAIIAFDDFYNADQRINVRVSGQVYGLDYCYSEITGAHREQITMPVFGVVAETGATTKTQSISGSDKITNGYFASLDEGASLAKLSVEFGGTQYKFGTVYLSYCPYPSDKFDLSQTISVGGMGSYVIVSDSKYNGSYVTNYTMLTDESLSSAVQGKYYPASYVGMANCYRDQLKAQGILTPLKDLSEDLPLYIEALGSIEVTKKILTFPVTVSESLTTFDNIETMYNELSTAIDVINAKITEYQTLADETSQEDDPVNKQLYQAKADKYRELLGDVANITNVNFKLSGFANNGMSYTYPVKVGWERACGGKGGFKKITAKAAEISEGANATLGIFPDFDFAYINNTSMFDGISARGNVSRMVDNRYANKPEYDSIFQEYVVYFDRMALVISYDVLDKLYTKFNKSYSAYGWDQLSVSTLGSDLNSNFDEDNPVNRDESETYVQAVLDKMANEQKYEVMTSVGNSYVYKYVKHILDAGTDSSHLNYSSYTVPFVGMVLHGYINYTGSAVNYAGSPDYNILRSIESGASLYYILCYQNTNYLKEDLILNDYYGIDYENWFDSIVTQYKTLNDAIGDLQNYEITDHRVIFTERIIDSSEVKANRALLVEEFIELVDAQLYDKINAAYDELILDPANVGRKITLNINKSAIINQAKSVLNVTEEELIEAGFVAKLDALISDYKTEYPGGSANPYPVSFNSVVYETKYAYVTDSFATDKNYEFTDYTLDNGNVVMVTYTNAESGDTVKFIINYNMFGVRVNLDATNSYELGAHGYVRID